MTTASKGKRRLTPGTRRWFCPHSLEDDRANRAAGNVEIVKLIDDTSEPGCWPLYRVRNVDNGAVADAFGDELAHKAGER